MNDIVNCPNCGRLVDYGFYSESTNVIAFCRNCGWYEEIEIEEMNNEDYKKHML